MISILGGTFLMGSDDFYVEERPVHRVEVGDFQIDEHPVTNTEFARFVEATAYRTVAERAPSPADYPGVDPAALVAGSLVFRRPSRSVSLGDWRAWWSYVPGASWRCPEGPGSSVAWRESHPVVHVAYEDARAYVRWAGKSLPTEAEWEYAARGGLKGATYVWGEEFAPQGRFRANTWHGEFPWQNLELDGYAGTSPVDAFEANGYGLRDMAGNVWEWTCDPYRPHGARRPKPCCMPSYGATSPSESASGEAQIPQHVIKGGSHLCAPNYCLRYRPAARQGQAIDSSTGHIGFRCVVRPGEEGGQR